MFIKTILDRTEKQILRRIWFMEGGEEYEEVEEAEGVEVEEGYRIC